MVFPYPTVRWACEMAGGSVPGFFLAESLANFENPSPNLVLGLSSECPRTARTLGQS